MPGNTDTRVVQMQFQNQEFERNIAKSTKSLSDFKKELKFGETSKGLKEFFDNFKNIDLSGLTNNVAKLADKFAGLGHISEMVLTTIQGKIRQTVAAMSNFVDSMTTAQIAVGKSKYEQLNKSVQTIMNATGRTEEEVYSVMEKLNAYTDQTSYNFTDMASNIGKFTSVGRELEESERAMEGIANWAALSGAGYTEASRAMYNISQAMGVGHMQLMDWKSIQNANMATIDFKNAVIEAAIATGDLVKTTDKSGKEVVKTAKKYGKETEVTVQNFQETLNKGWFTNDVMINTLDRFADTTDVLGKRAYEAAQKCTTFTDVLQAWRDQISTGWMTSFRHIFGDLGESMEFFSNICNKVAEDLDGLISTRNMILEGWAQGGGRKSLMQSILGDYGEDVKTGAYGILDVLHDVGSLISDGFWSLLKPFAAGEVGALWDMDDGKWRIAWLTVQLENFTNSIQSFLQSVRNFFTEEVTIGNESMSRIEMIRNIVDGLNGAIVLAANVIAGLASFIGGIIADLTPSFDKIAFVFSSIGEMIYGTATATTQQGTILDFFQKLREDTKPLTDGINQLVSSVGDLILKFVKWGVEDDHFQKFSDGFSGALQTINSAISNFGGPVFQFFADMADILGDLFDKDFSEESLATVGDRIAKAFQDMLDKIVEGLPQGLKTFWEKVKGVFSKSADDSGGGEGILGGLRDIFGDTSIERVMGIIGGVLGVGALFKLYNLIARIKKPLAGLAESLMDLKNNVLGKLFGVLGLFSSDESDERVEVAKIFGIGTIIAAIGYLISQLAKLGNVEGGWSGIARMAAGMLVALGGLELFIWSAHKLDIGAKNIMSFSALAMSIQSLISALTPLANTSWEGLGKMAAGLVVTIGAFLYVAKKIYEFPGEMSVKIAGVVGLAFGLGILIRALRPLANTSWEGMGKMGAGLAVLMIALLEFAKKLYNFPGAENASVKITGIIGFVFGIAVLISALRPLANISWNGLGKMGAGLAFVMIALLEFTKKLYMFPGAGNASVKITGLMGLVFGIGVLVMALTPLADISWEGMGRMGAGLVGILVALYVFARQLYMFPGADNASVKITGIVGLVFGIAVLVAALKPLADTSWEGMGRMGVGLVAVMGALLIFARMLYMFPGAENASVKITGLTGLAVGIAVLIFALKPLADTSWEGMGKMGVGLVAVMGALLAFSKLVGKIKIKPSSLVSLLAYAAAIAAVSLAFSVSLMAVRGMDIGTILAFSAGLSAVLVAMAAVMAITSNINIGSGLKGIALIAVGIAAIMGVLSLMMPILMGSIGSSLTSMAGKMRLMSEMISDFTTTMNGVGDGDIDSARSKLDQIKDLLISLSGFQGLQHSADSFSVAMSTLATGMEIFWDHSSKVGDLSNTGVIKLLKDIQDNYTGLETITNLNLHNLQANIAGLGGAMMLYAMGAKQVADATGGEVDEEGITAAVKIMDRIATTLVDEGGFQIPEMPSDTELSDWGVQLAALAGALVSFEQAGSGLGAGTDKALETLDFFKELKEKLESSSYKENMAWLSEYMSSYRTEAGELIDPQTGQELAANDDVLNSFGTHIEMIGKHLASFAASTTRINEETGAIEPIDYTKATEALQSFLDIKEKMPKIGGALDWIEGTKQDLTDLGTDIEGLSLGLTNFAKNMAGEGENGTTFKSEDVKAATDAMDEIYKAIAEINKMFDPTYTSEVETFQTSYVAMTWTGDDVGRDIEALGKGLGSLGASLMLFSSNTTGNGEGGTPYDPQSVTNATTAMDSMITFLQQIQGKLPVIGGLAQAVDTAIHGHTLTPEELGAQLGAIGDGLGKLGAGITSGGWSTGTTGADEAFKMIDNLLAVMVKMDQLQIGAGALMMSPTVWLESIREMVQGLTAPSTMGDGGTIVDDLSHFMDSLDKALADVSPDIEKLQALTTVTELINQIGSMDTTVDLGAIGDTLTQKTAESIVTGTDSVIVAGNEMVTKVITAMAESAKASSLETVGHNVVIGFANGMANASQSAVNAAAAICQAVYDTFHNFFIIGSPSKLFMEMGGFLSEGLGIGISNGSHYAVNAASALSQETISTTADTISLMASMLDQDLDANPTISPVIDLTNFDSGISAMQRSLAGNDMTIDTSVVGRLASNALPNRSKQEINQNGSDYSGIFSKIDQVTQQIETLGTQFSKMQVVLDSGVVAGGVTDDVDRNLGRAMFYASRNN